MVQFIDTLIAVLAGFILLMVLRWLWLKAQQHRLLQTPPTDDDLRFEDVRADEEDQMFHGRVISRLRSHLVDGRIEVNWQFKPKYIHNGFVLIGKSRRNSGSWEPLAFEPHQDSGSWIECFNYGESRSYLFIVKKVYRFFFGLVPNDHVEVVYDQISFSVRRGRAVKEKAEELQDNIALYTQMKRWQELEDEVRALALTSTSQKPRLPASSQTDPVAKLKRKVKHKSAVADYVEKRKKQIEANSKWSQKRKREELKRLEEIAEEIALEETE